jgi:3-oxoacyl-[acyl-carrier-protein] synthase II
VRRIVVTGIGAVSPLGVTFHESWEALKEGRSGIGPVTRFDTSGAGHTSAGELKVFEPEALGIPRKDTRRFDPFTLYAAAAASMAVEDAGIGPSLLRGAGIILGSSRGGVSSLERAVRERPNAYLMSGTTVSMAASYTAMRLGIGGPILGLSNACASGSNAVGEALRLIRYGGASVVLAGGAEAPLCRLCVEGYGASGALSSCGISRPFDRKRDGFVLSEGAAVLVLEEFGSARKRGVRIYGEVLGYGNTSDARHCTVPDRDGQERAMREALAEAGLSPGDIDYVSAHATSTVLGDRTEGEAITSVFGPAGVAVGAVKSTTGHLLGASGALEAAFALMSITEGVIAPTVNLEDPEEGLRLVLRQRKEEIRFVLSNSFGFGGVNSVLVFGRP